MQRVSDPKSVANTESTLEKRWWSDTSEVTHRWLRLKLWMRAIARYFSFSSLPISFSFLFAFFPCLPFPSLPFSSQPFSSLLFATILFFPLYTTFPLVYSFYYTVFPIYLSLFHSLSHSCARILFHSSACSFSLFQSLLLCRSLWMSVSNLESGSGGHSGLRDSVRTSALSERSSKRIRYRHITYVPFLSRNPNILVPF